MTIDERFSAERFRALPADDPQATAALLAQLEEAVAAELHEALSATMAEIAGRLNSLGHRLSAYSEEVGEIGWHDTDDPPAGQHCRLRVDTDSFVSIGWCEHSFNDDADEPPPSVWEVRLLVETDDPAERERITEAVANIGCPLPVSEHDRCPTPWFVVSTPLEHLDEGEAARWRDVLNRE